MTHIYSGCCRDLFLERPINDVDIILDTQELQFRAMKCDNNGCVFNKMYSEHKDEYVRIGGIKRYDLRMNQWMSSEKIINAKLLLKNIQKTSNGGIVGIKDNSKNINVVAFQIFCANGVDIDFMDNTFYFDHGCISTFQQMKEILPYCEPIKGKLLQSNTCTDIANKIDEILMKKEGYTGKDLELDVMTSFTNKESKLFTFFADEFGVSFEVLSAVLNEANRLDFLWGGSSYFRCDFFEVISDTFDEYRKDVATHRKKFDKSGDMRRDLFLREYFNENASWFYFRPPNNLGKNKNFDQNINKYNIAIESKQENEDFKEKEQIRQIASLFPLIPTNYYPISHLSHCAQTDCTFNALYFDLKSVLNDTKTYDDIDAQQNVVQLWMAHIKDPCLTGIDDVENGRVMAIPDEFLESHGIDIPNVDMLTEDQTVRMVQSQPEMIMYRIMKNASKLLDKFGKERIQIDDSFVDAIREYWLVDFWSWLHDLLTNQFADYEFDQDRFVGHFWRTYEFAMSKVPLDVRVSLMYLFGLDTFIFALMELSKPFRASVEKYSKQFKGKEEEALLARLHQLFKENGSPQSWQKVKGKAFSSRTTDIEIPKQVTEREEIGIYKIYTRE